MKTTITIEKEIKSRLDKFKIHHMQTYEEVISGLMDVIEKKTPDEKNTIKVKWK